MASETGQFRQYVGPLPQIPTDSVGFLFLSQYLPSIDAVDRSSQRAIQLQHLLSPNAVFVTNGGPPVPAARVQEMLKMREGMLEEFYHLDNVKITEMVCKEGRGSLICETTSV